MSLVFDGNAAASTSAGSQKALRARNIDLVVGTLGIDGPQTQAMLARRTRLSAGTISSIVRELTEQRRVSARPTISGGRRAVEVALVPDGRVVVGVDVGRAHLQVMAMDTGRRTFGMRGTTLHSSHLPSDTLRIARQMVDEMLAESGVDRSDVVLCGVAVPASLNPVTGRVVQASVLQSWAGIDLVEATTRALDLPVVLENDANLGAIAHAGTGPFSGVRCLVFVKVGTGIGAGLAFDGKIYESASGIAGEIGHGQLIDGGEVCTCGNRGCLETVASTRRIVADFARIRPDSEVELDDVIAAVAAGDPAAIRLLHDAGAQIGRAIAPICNLLSPDVVVVGGPLARVGASLFDGIVQSTRQRSLSTATAHTRFVLSDLGDHAEVHGACLLALRRVITEGHARVSN
ncbi:ROK family transcriptional regulator [Cellulomonas sp. URHD0024]|uniref:ROK family transcriptional regulator n=1 Tax=Cellulomonas sp. URHD0024 TaxID=1302620 RepID=UPI00042834B7|nr:ROK family transcriptional regulator [Cellulomonas sp. URHD0024]